MTKAKSRCVCVCILHPAPLPTLGLIRWGAFRQNGEGWGWPNSESSLTREKTLLPDFRKRRSQGRLGGGGQVTEVLGGTSLDQPGEWESRQDFEGGGGSVMV